MDRAHTLPVEKVADLAREVAEELMHERFDGQIFEPKVGVFPELGVAGYIWDPDILHRVKPEAMLELAHGFTERLRPEFDVQPEVKLLKGHVTAGFMPIDPRFQDFFR